MLRGPKNAIVQCSWDGPEHKGPRCKTEFLNLTGMQHACQLHSVAAGALRDLERRRKKTAREAACK